MHYDNEGQRSQLLALLREWQRGTINEREVHQKAESIVEQFSELPAYDETDPGSVTFEVLLQLDALNHGLITLADIPAMEAFLNTPIGQEVEGWTAWRDYWKNVDFEERRQALKSNPYYIT